MREDRYKKLAVCLLIGIVLAVDYCYGQTDALSEERFVFDAPQASHQSLMSDSSQTFTAHPKRETTSRFNPVQRPPQGYVEPGVCRAPMHHQTPNLNHDEIENGNLIAKNVLNLANNIANGLYYTKAVKTQVFSPLSIAGALSLVFMGSRGETFRELANALGYTSIKFMAMPYLIHREFGAMVEELENNIIRRPISPWKCQKIPDETRTHNTLSTPAEEYHQVSVANGIFVQNDFSLNPDYKKAVESIYGGEVQEMDFKNAGSRAVEQINNWVFGKTYGKIRNILGNGINGDTKTIITSALYFKALWEKSFIHGGTSLKNFYPDGEGGESVQVEMMANGGIFPFYNSEKYDCRILGLPYKGNLSTMYIILPNNSSRQKLRDLQRELTADAIEEMISNMRMKTTVMIFPKMHIENSINLREILAGLGMRSVFDPASSDLSLISRGVKRTVQYTEPEDHFNIRPTITSYNPNTRQKPMVGLVSRSGLNVADPYHYYQLSNRVGRGKRAVKYKVESSFRRSPEPLRLKDFIIAKRITKLNPDKKSIRHRRQAPTKRLTGEQSLKNLDEQRHTSRPNPGLFAENIVHKVDLTVNEKGTEGGAATVVYLTRSGTDVIFRVDTPFMFLIRHEPTKLPIFYGSVFEPVNNS